MTMLSYNFVKHNWFGSFCCNEVYILEHLFFAADFLKTGKRKVFVCVNWVLSPAEFLF